MTVPSRNQLLERNSLEEPGIFCHPGRLPAALPRPFYFLVTVVTRKRLVVPFDGALVGLAAEILLGIFRLLPPAFGI